MVTTSIEVLVERLAPTKRTVVAHRWFIRAVRTHLRDLLALAGEVEGAERLEQLPADDTPRAVAETRDALFEVLEQAVESWHAAIDSARRDRRRWAEVLELLGPEQVTPWSAYLDLIEESSELLGVPIDTARCVAIGLWAQRAASATTKLRASVGLNDAKDAAEAVAQVVVAQETARQRQEVLDLLPV